MRCIWPVMLPFLGHSGHLIFKKKKKNNFQNICSSLMIYFIICFSKKWIFFGGKIAISTCPNQFFSFALCYCIAELLSWRGRSSSVRRPSVDIVFSETVKWIDTKFLWQVPIHHISRPFFVVLQNFKFLIFYNYFCFR